MINLLKWAINSNLTARHEFGGDPDQPVSIEAFVTQDTQQLHVYYQGLLKNAGAKEVYLHYGTHDWANTTTVKMERNYNGSFTARIQPDSPEVEFCFKDNADNWDNNNGLNWKAHISLE
ncbi:MAG TPA: carbohydrate-binding protein [Bacillota bacterium]|nr:carbohydrate-binding protein [Bacillota bacterium]